MNANDPRRGEAIDCPRCRSTMGNQRGRAGWLAACENCGGTWFDNAFCVAIAADEVWFDRYLIGRAEARGAKRPPRLEESSPLNVPCPVCSKPLGAEVITGGVMIDACRDHGAFFDLGELRSYRVERQRLRRSPAAEPSGTQAEEVMARVMRRLERLHLQPIEPAVHEVLIKTSGTHEASAVKALIAELAAMPPPAKPPPRKRAPRKLAQDLRCPACRAPTRTCSSHIGVLAACPRCAGAWLDNAACVALTHGELLEPDVAFLARFETGGARVDVAPGPFRRASVPRTCPICTELLVATKTQKMTIDLCLVHGAFFDAKELGQLHAIYARRAGTDLEAEETKARGVSAWLRNVLGFRD